MHFLTKHSTFNGHLLLAFCVLSFTASAELLNPAPKIIGGKTSNSTDWPWMSAIVLKSNTLVFCGASLIDPEWVLTAAHCVYNKSANDLEVLINQANLLSNSGERIALKDIVIHPQFKRATLVNDIALLHLAAPAVTKPVAIINESSTLDAVDHDSIALGWGNTSTYRQIFPDFLQEVSLPIISNAACKERMTGIQDSMLCAGPEEGGKDTCEGDSGGPLVVFDKSSLNWIQVGITSFGLSSCASSGKYGVYTRLKLFKSFIAETLCRPDQIPQAPILHVSLLSRMLFLNWNNPTNATSYEITYSPYPSGFPISTLVPHYHNLFYISLPKSAAYYVSITALNGNCRSDTSNTEHFIVP